MDGEYAVCWYLAPATRSRSMRAAQRRRSALHRRSIGRSIERATMSDKPYVERRRFVVGVLNGGEYIYIVGIRNIVRCVTDGMVVDQHLTRQNRIEALDDANTRRFALLRLVIDKKHIISIIYHSHSGQSTQY